jgi:hypothetical protein
MPRLRRISGKLHQEIRDYAESAKLCILTAGKTQDRLLSPRKRNSHAF